MVYIKRIDLRGFKTFGRKATVKLSQGLTVITGPNGSGKSNILDALRFSLGELSPKELRGASLSDLISKSTLQTPPRSVYVSVQFDNTDRRLPIDSGAVTISREFYKGGEGVYRLNGRRVSRKQLTELLSSADISVAGYNIVPQHAITRLAEVTSEERRKIVEDLVGLGVYDLKKVEAQVQLTQADTNLKIASARVDEVRLRVESLERERNDFLRHSLLTKEIFRLQAQTISGKISDLRRDAQAIRDQAGSKESQLNNLRSDRDRLSTSKLQLEQKMRDLQERLLDQGGQKINELERYLGETNSRIASLKAEIEAKRLNLELLKQQEEGLKQETGQHEGETKTQESELVKLKEEAASLEETLKDKEPIALQASSQAQAMRESQIEASNMLDKLDEELESANAENAKITPKIETESARIDLIQEQLKALLSQETELKKALEELQKKKDELNALRVSQAERLNQIEHEINQGLVLRELKEKGLDEATKTAESASESILEFDAQRGVMDALAPRQAALAEIRELHVSGVLHNIVGRLRDLVRFEKRYERAVRAACADWLDSLVVKDTAAAVDCIEHLKRQRLSRIKIIPLDIVTGSQPVNKIPEIEGVISRAVDCVECDPSLEAAVNFVLGDTIVTDNQRAAYLASTEGFRAVVLTGDLYEPGGALEGGYYREPLDIDSIAPRMRLLNELKETSASLSKLIEKDRSDLGSLNSRFEHLREERAALQRDRDHIFSNSGETQDRLRHTTEEIGRTSDKAKSLQERINQDQANIQSLLTRRTELEQILRRLEEQRTNLKNKVRSDQIRKSEEQSDALAEELDQLRERKTILDLRVSNLESSIGSMTRILERTKNQLSKIQENEEEVESKLELAAKELEGWTGKLAEATKEREDLSKSLESLRKSRAQTQTELDTLNESLQRAEREIEPLNSSLTMLRLELNKKELEENYLIEELNRLGFQKPTQTYPLDSRAVEENLSTLRSELQEIGAVNELAVAHYEEQKNNYKQLSIRINQLEEEKQTILRFMEELEQKKRDTFMSVFERLNQNFNEVFSKITDGGNGRLVLEKPEEIFSGGVDMQLAFPGKAELSIGSASGGEKSVATVCFLLALQAIHPMPFYVFDEIDAHLDMVNSQRLADLLRERSADSQFIVVSLKDTTISRASGVFGIFIQDGYSQIVSLPKPEGQANVRA